MPRYLSFHTLACLTRQGAEELSRKLTGSSSIKTRHIQVSMYEGKMLVEFEATDRETAEAWLKEQGFHYDWLIRVELEAAGGKLAPVH